MAEMIVKIQCHNCGAEKVREDLIRILAHDGLYYYCKDAECWDAYQEKVGASADAKEKNGD